MPDSDFFTQLTIAMSNPHKPELEKLRQTCSTTLKAIPNANRVSLWKFGEDQAYLQCLLCFDQLDNVYSSDQVLRKANFPEYFAGLTSSNYIMASHAREHQSTRCFNQDYFIPNQIHSLLDYVLHHDFVPTGVICCESVGRRVEWQEEDLNALRKIATIISMFFCLNKVGRSAGLLTESGLKLAAYLA
ncbi:MAG: hypothetical protein GW763_09730 [Paraglaciecola sp.]|nr:hypothetical protein [Paraglaciecola sp.]NCT48249.1 hypothetical protein [Paraglaciecola sp.]